MNAFLMHISYSQITVISTILYFVVNLLMLPFAYIVGIAKKLQLLITVKIAKLSNTLDFVLFLSIGWLSLLLCIIIDTKDFI